MSEKRMIECPVCCGLSRCDGTNSLSCHRCGSSGTIPDRRKPTANDRVVERIKPMLETFIYNERPWDDKDTTARIVLDIIREEAERGD